MPRDGAPTRARIMEAALELILETGFSAASVERIIQRAGITKGTFFYHFPSKQDLAEALVREWAAQDIRYLEENLARAGKLARDPVQQLLVFVGLFEELFELPADEQPGCLYASFCYEAELFDADIANMIREAFNAWRAQLAPLFAAAIKAHPPRVEVKEEELVDLLGVIFEGGFVMSRIYGDARMTAAHLRHYRNYLELLFT